MIKKLIRGSVGPNRTSELTLISARSPINFCAKHWCLWLEVRALWSYCVEKSWFGVQFEELVKCKSSIQNHDHPSTMAWVGLQSESSSLTRAAAAIFLLGSIVPVYHQKCTTTNGVEMMVVRGNHEPLCLLHSMCLAQDGGFALNDSFWVMYQTTPNRSGCSKERG